MRPILLLTAALLAIGLAGPIPAAAQEPVMVPDPCPRSSWVAGSVELCAGTLVYRDYVFDDYGAWDLIGTPTASTTGTLSRPAGAQRYPAGAEATADLVDLRLRVAGDRLEATFHLNALHKPDQTVATLVVGLDDGQAIETSFDSGDTATNTISGSIPLPAGERWQLQAYTAQADGTIMNVAFRGTGEQAAAAAYRDPAGRGEPQVYGAWWEDRQAAALYQGDISEFIHTVEVADLTGGVTRPAPVVTGFHQRVYVSDYALGDGMTYDPEWGRHGDSGQICEQGFHFLGRYQPYGVYVPDQEGPLGVQLALHGCNANHASLVNQEGMQQRFGDELGRIVVVPLGRGPVGYYSDISERDVLDVLADVHANHDTDPDQVFAGGYSMGGYGALRFAMLYPQLFAGLVNWVGFTGDGGNNPLTDEPLNEYSSGAIGNVIDFVGNLRHVPSAHLYGGADELVHVHTSTALAQRLAAHEVAYEFFLHPYAEHFTFALADGWEKEAAYTEGLRRVTNPHRVTYRTDPSLAFPEYGIHHDGAYWVSGIRGREDGYADVDVETFACGGDDPVYATGTDAGVGPGVWAWASENRTLAGTEPLTAEPRLAATLTNVSSLTIDAAAACLEGVTFDYQVETDGPAELSLSDGRVLALGGAGVHEGSLAAAGAAGPGPTAVQPSTDLPATGGGLGLVGLALAAAGYGLRKRTTCAPSMMSTRPPATGTRTCSS